MNFFFYLWMIFFFKKVNDGLLSWFMLLEFTVNAKWLSVDNKRLLQF